MVSGQSANDARWPWLRCSFAEKVGTWCVVAWLSEHVHVIDKIILLNTLFYNINLHVQQTSHKTTLKAVNNIRYSKSDFTF